MRLTDQGMARRSKLRHPLRNSMEIDCIETDETMASTLKIDWNRKFSYLLPKLLEAVVWLFSCWCDNDSMLPSFTSSWQPLVPAVAAVDDLAGDAELLLAKLLSGLAAAAAAAVVDPSWLSLRWLEDNRFFSFWSPETKGRHLATEQIFFFNHKKYIGSFRGKIAFNGTMSVLLDIENVTNLWHAEVMHHT